FLACCRLRKAGPAPSTRRAAFALRRAEGVLGRASPSELMPALMKDDSREAAQGSQSVKKIIVINKYSRQEKYGAWSASPTACSLPALGRHTHFDVLDNGYKFDMDDQETLELARKAIHYAAFRDFASGGIVRGATQRDPPPERSSRTELF
ncbi:hypothetical protein HPB47_005194, partial [Ixodes persulcatus]